LEIDVAESVVHAILKNIYTRKLMRNSVMVHK